MGFSTAYTAVSWTAGDVITEAKLDAMVANDQAYDSHADQGLEFNEMATPSTPAANKVRLYAKDNSGVSGLVYLKDNGEEVDLSSNDGWISANETWTYASASTITVPSGAASKYKIGDKLKWTANSVVLYAYVTGIADTVLTTSGNVVTNYTITANYYSHQSNPIGFPTYFSWSSTITASTGTPTTTTLTYAFFKFIENVFYAWVSVTVVNKGTATGEMMISLPPGISFSNTQVGIGRENGVTGGFLTSYGSSQISAAYPAGTLWTNGYHIDVFYSNFIA